MIKKCEESSPLDLACDCYYICQKRKGHKEKHSHKQEITWNSGDSDIKKELI